MLADAARDVDQRLEALHGRKRRSHRGDPLDGLVRTVLSQHTSDVNSHRAFVALRKAFPTWEGVRHAEAGDVAEAIGSGGLANIKAARIKAILDQVQADHGSLSLTFLKDMPQAEALGYLLGFPGVGPKTRSVRPHVLLRPERLPG